MPDDITPSTPDTIVLIHGLWMTPRSWEHWAARYRARGFTVLTPAWPGLEGDVEALRHDPTPIARLSAEAIVEHLAGIVRGLARPPILMGHSFGGAFVQLLLDRGLGAVGVAIASAPVRGVLGLPLSTLRSSWSILRNPRNADRAVDFDLRQFHYAFGNAIEKVDSAQAWERYAVPGAGRVLFQGALANFSPRTPFKVNFRRAGRAPLLFIGGGRDHVVPSWVVSANAHKYAKSPATTEFTEFPARSHFTLGEPGWESVADYALDWALDHVRPSAGVSAPADALATPASSAVVHATA